MHFWLRTGLVNLAAAGLIAAAAPAWAAGDAARQRIEVAFVLDTTGSMADLIDGAKRKIWSIANAIVDVDPDADVRMALIAYRDKGDEYVLQTFDMSDDVQGLYGRLVKLVADGGGDTPESVNEALDAGVRKLQWTKGDQARKIIFLVGDAPPHMDYENAPKYPEVLERAARDAITVNAVQAGEDPDTTAVWREIAQMGGGRFISIPQDGGRIIVVETPYDDEIIVLQRELDATVLPYGDERKQFDLREKMETKARAPASVQADNSSYYSKKAGPREIVTGGGDLLTDIRNGSRTLEEVSEGELPEALRSKSMEEKNLLVGRRMREREAMEGKMSELVKKRDAFLSEHAAGREDAAGDSFDGVVKEALSEQLK